MKENYERKMKRIIEILILTIQNIYKKNKIGHIKKNIRKKLKI